MAWKQHVDWETIDFSAEIRENIPGISDACLEKCEQVQALLNIAAGWPLYWDTRDYALDYNWYQFVDSKLVEEPDDFEFQEWTINQILAWNIILAIVGHGKPGYEKEFVFVCKKDWTAKD